MGTATHDQHSPATLEGCNCSYIHYNNMYCSQYVFLWELVACQMIIIITDPVAVFLCAPPPLEKIGFCQLMAYSLIPTFYIYL